MVKWQNGALPKLALVSRVKWTESLIRGLQTMKISKLIEIAGLVSILAFAGTALAGPQRVEKVVVPIKGQPGYAYVWVTGSRIPQKVKISPIGTLTHSPLSEFDRRQINWTRGGTVRQALSNEPTLSFRGH